MNTSRVLLKTSWEEVFGNETYNIYNNQTLIKGQGYYVTDTRFSNMTNNAISIICDANNSYGCKFLIENSVFSEISCENYSPLTIYFLGDVVQKNIAAFNTTNKVTGESTGEYSGQFERIDCEYVNVKRNEINESCISGCGKYTDNNPGTQISLNRGILYSRSCNISNGKSRVATLFFLHHHSTNARISCINEINNTSTGNLYAISIISTMGDNNTINFSLCSIITNKVNIVLGCQYAVHVYLDNCTLINPDAHTLFVAKNGNAYITASNCYTNSYPESASTKGAPADAIKFENITELSETKIIHLECNQIVQMEKTLKILSFNKKSH